MHVGCWSQGEGSRGVGKGGQGKELLLSSLGLPWGGDAGTTRLQPGHPQLAQTRAGQLRKTFLGVLCREKTRAEPRVLFSLIVDPSFLFFQTRFACVRQGEVQRELMTTERLHSALSPILE